MLNRFNQLNNKDTQSSHIKNIYMGKHYQIDH